MPTSAKIGPKDKPVRLMTLKGGAGMLRMSLLVCIMLSVSITNTIAGMNEFQSCRCKNGLATKGDDKQEVKQECGEPVTVKFNVGRDCSEMWLYNFGPNEFMQGICFDRSGRVKKVLSLNTGY